MSAVIAAASVALASAGCANPNLSAHAPAMAGYEGRGAGPTDVGFYRLLFDEFHSLSEATMSRSAVPWKVMTAAMLAYHRQRDPALPLTEGTYLRLLGERYGFLLPARIANWPAGTPQPALGRPLGIVGGVVTRRWPRVEMEVTNLGCSTCHSGVLYDAAGNPTRDAWIGLPSTSINLARYAEDAFGALARAADRPDETLALVKQIFPHISDRELATLRRFYFPAVRDRVTALRATVGAFTPYSNGGPGLTNGVGTLQFYQGVFDARRRRPEQVAFTSVPDLGALGLRPSILCDGIYAPPGWPHSGPLTAPVGTEAHVQALAGITTVVTIGTLGVTPEVAVENIPRVRDAIDWIVRAYRPPQFPGPIDAALAAEGAVLYAAHCAVCHGTYRERADGRGLQLGTFPNHLVPADVIDTDPVRARIVGDDANALFRGTALAPHLDARGTGGYISPPLTSLWATAPYLHNGSVPTLWHLMHPRERPPRFQIGGHRLDLQRVGIDGEVGADGVYRYPAGYRPWTLPDVYDTRSPGRRNGGHEEPFDELDEPQKTALLEFLKRM